MIFFFSFPSLSYIPKKPPSSALVLTFRKGGGITMELLQGRPSACDLKFQTCITYIYICRPTTPVAVSCLQNPQKILKGGL